MVCVFDFIYSRSVLTRKKFKQKILRNKAEVLDYKIHMADPQDRDIKALSGRNPYRFSLSFIMAIWGNVDKILCTKYSTFGTAFTRSSPTHYTLHTTHCKLHTTHYTLYTIHYTLYTKHYTLHTIRYTPQTTHYTLYTTHHTL